EANLQQACPPSGGGVADRVAHLDRGGALLQSPVDGLEQVRRSNRIGVDEYRGIGTAVRLEFKDCALERVVLSMAVWLIALDDRYPGSLRERGRVVVAVVGNHEHAESVLRPIEARQTREHALDQALLVVRDHENVEAPAPWRGGRRHQPGGERSQQ